VEFVPVPFTNQNSKGKYMTISERHRRALTDAEAGWNIAAIYDAPREMPGPRRRGA
jgi:hypothetical protein